jgi:diaminopimelate epimerase
MHGLGNDYIFINCFEETVDDPQKLSVVLSNRHFGVGSDGLILIMPSRVADCRMRMFNADGSEGLMCGNGIRCVGKYVYERGIVQKPNITVETADGIKNLHLHVTEGVVEYIIVDMGIAKTKTIEFDNLFATYVTVGNPHLVLFVNDVEELDIEKEQKKINENPLFNEGINIEFVKRVRSNLYQTRVYERGSGETLACGTGACAVIAAAIHNKFTCYNKPNYVNLPGGTLMVSCIKGGRIFLRGSAEYVFEGVVNL